MDKLHRRAVVVAAVAVVSIGIAACGSSSSKSASPAASTPATPSTPGTTSTISSGPLTKASYNSAGQPVVRPAKEFIAALKLGNQAIAGAAPKLVAALQKSLAQVSTLKPQSSAAAAAVQKYISVVKQEIVLVQQMGKAASANNTAAVKATLAKFHVVSTQAVAANAQLYALLR